MAMMPDEKVACLMMFATSTLHDTMISSATTNMISCIAVVMSAPSTRL